MKKLSPELVDLINFLKKDIEYFRENKNLNKEYFRGRIEEAKYIMQKIKSL